MKEKDKPIIEPEPLDNIMYDVAMVRLESERSELDIDFDRIAHLSTFQRLIIEIIKMQFPNIFKGVDVRVSKEKTAKQFNKQKAFMRDCVSEFKELLEKKGGE